MNFASRLPARIGIALAAICFMVLHVVAIESGPMAAAGTLSQLASSVQHQFIHTFARILQYVVPFGLLVGAFASYVNRSRAQSLFVQARANPSGAVSSMPWRDFERLVGAAFQQRGFAVTPMGGSRPDGGIDLVLSRNGERHLVQCKHWRTRQVGAPVVRELNGVVAAQGAAGGYVVTGGHFTREAREFAESCPITLLDGQALSEFISSASDRPVSCSSKLSPAPAAASPVAIRPSQLVPSCPRCGTPMVVRIAKQGRNAGGSFWGCQQFSKGCRETMPMT